MDIIQIQIIIIACLVSIVSVIPGIFLILRGVALMSDAISHAILLGIVVMFLIVQKLESPLLIIGACGAGVLTVACIEMLISIRCLKKDAAIGIVFPLFFSVGVILVSRYARNVHLDTDMILLGEIAFAPFNKLVINDIDLGPYAIWLLGIILLINLSFLICFYKELSITTFDPDFAYVLGFSPTLVYYLLMTMTSITTVGAFDVVGSIVVVALMITPAATAYLLTNCLSHMIYLSIIFAIMSAIIGYGFAYLIDVSIAGAIATITGIIFLIALLFAPEKGVISSLLNHRKKRFMIAKDLIGIYLLKNKKTSMQQLCEIYNWSIEFVKKLLDEMKHMHLIKQKNNFLYLTDRGIDYSRAILLTLKRRN
ncbi:MAG: metal ABC transporter permease [Candidatus Babeliales bacterium]